MYTSMWVNSAWEPQKDAPAVEIYQCDFFHDAESLEQGTKPDPAWAHTTFCIDTDDHYIQGNFYQPPD